MGYLVVIIMLRSAGTLQRTARHAQARASITPRFPIPTMLRVLLHCWLGAVRVATQFVSALRDTGLRVPSQQALHPRNSRWLGICEVVAFLLVSLDVVETERLITDGALCRDRCVRARTLGAAQVEQESESNRERQTHREREEREREERRERNSLYLGQIGGMACPCCTSFVLR